jgi:hypothetical protein
VIRTVVKPTTVTANCSEVIRPRIPKYAESAGFITRPARATSPTRTWTSALVLVSSALGTETTCAATGCCAAMVSVLARTASR